MAKAKENLDEVIRRYEKMSATQVRAELKKLGIDPQVTFIEFLELVDESRRKNSRARSV